MHHYILCSIKYDAALYIMHHYISCIIIYHTSLYIMHFGASQYYHASSYILHFGASLYYHASLYIMSFGASLYIMLTIYHASLIIMHFAASLYIMLTKYHVFWYDWPKVNFCIITSRVSVWCMRILPHFCPRVQEIFIYEFGDIDFCTSHCRELDHE